MMELSRKESIYDKRLVSLRISSFCHESAANFAETRIQCGTVYFVLGGRGGAVDAGFTH